MKTKKTLSLLLCLVMLISMIAGTGAMSLSASTGSATVPFRSPAILANVGEKIDLSKYGVEFAEGVTTTEGLTWWKEGVSGITVPYANPALFANVGDLVNFADYDVELTKGNVVKADNLTWKQGVTQKVIPAATPYLQTEAGEKVELKYYTVEGMGDSLSWTLDGKAVTSITAKAGDVLTVSDGTTTKDVIVATKNGTVDNYIVYENNFEDASDLDRITRTTLFGADATLYPFSLGNVDGQGGVFSTDRDYSTSTSSQQNASFALPEYLWGMSDYTVQWKGSVVDYTDARDGSTSTTFTGTAAMGLFINGDMTPEAWKTHYIEYSRSNSLYFYTRAYSADNKYANTLLYKKQYASVMSNFGKNGWVRFKVEVAGGTNVTTYYDYDSDTKTYTGSYIKLKEYDFAAVDGQTHLATNGAIGFSFYRSDWNVDDIKITVAPIEYATKDASVTYVSYTPAEKGVTAFTVTDGTTSRDVYLVAKNAEDTEYVLYENGFEASTDLDSITRTEAFGANADLFPFEIIDDNGNGVLSADRSSSYTTSSQQNASLTLPEYLWNFSDYTVEWKGSPQNYISTQDGTTSFASTAAMGLFINGDLTENAWKIHYIQYSRSNSLYFYTRQYSEDNKYANTLKFESKHQYVMSNLYNGTWVGFKVDVADGTNVTTYYDYQKNEDDTSLSGMTGEYSKLVEYDFATVDGQTNLATNGAMGFSFYRSDWYVDDIKITVSADGMEPTVQLNEITTFTPVEAGVTPITVKCGDVEKTIYVVAKNAADTEYVLYENNFDSEEDANDLTVIQGEADMTVADGQLTIDGKTTIGSNSDDGAYIRLPEWLGAFGDYEISAKVVRDTYKSSSEALGFFARSANADDAESLYIVRSRFTNTVSDCVMYGERIPGTAKPRTYSWGLRKNTSMHNASTDKYNIVKMGVAGDTVNMQIIDQDDDGTADDNYVLYATEQKELRTGYIGLFITEVIVHYDYIRVTVPALPDAPTKAAFTPDADLAEGTIAGELDVTLPGTGIEPSDVVFYWGNGEGKLPGYASFEKILVVNNATKLSYTIPAGTVVPAGATELRVYAMNLAGESTDCIVIPLDGITAKADEKLFSFLVNSDWHIAAAMSATTGLPTYSTATSDAHFIQMIERFKAADPSATQMFVGGDIVDGQKGAAAEYARLVELWETYAQGYTFDGILGNHEYWYNADEETAGNTTREYTVNNFINYMGVPMTAEKPYYSKDFNGYQFFFLNTIERDGTSRQSHNDSTLGAEQIAWLDEGLAAATANGKPAFVFHHQPITMSDEENNQITDRDDLVAVLKKYPTAIFVSSHTHDALSQQSTFALASASMCNMVDTSAVTFVIPAHYNKGTENVRNMSEGYLVEMYADRVVFKGMDLMTGEWLPTANFSFAYEEVNVQEPNTAVAETDDEGKTTITVKADEGYELKAGSLWVEDVNGNAFVPTRVGWRNGGDASQYEVVDNEGNPIGEAPFTVHAEFYQPGVDGAPLNMGLVGTSVNIQESGLRFVHRLNVYKEGEKYYMLSNGQNVEVTEYGLLVAAGTVLTGDPNRLTLEKALESKHIQEFAWPDVNKYYDLCSEYADIAVQVTNIEANNAGDVDIITRTYVKLADGTVAYGKVAVDTYNAQF